MEDFSRNPETKNNFEDNLVDIIEITLKIKDDFESTYNKHSENKYRFDQIKKMLSSESRVCYFQKKSIGNDKYSSSHKILIPIDTDKAIEALIIFKSEKVDVFTELYYYQVNKLKEVNFINEPIKHTVKRNCIFNITEIKKSGGSNKELFKELYKSIESLDIPTVDINKEKDKQIWSSYVIALKKLVKQKEQVWKIQNIKTPYSEKREGDSERSNYVDIFINEKDMMNQFEKSIVKLFNPKELDDYGVSENKAFIEFNNIKELNSVELNQLRTLGEEYFYELTPQSPMNYVSGEIAFKYADNFSKENILSELVNKLQLEYQLKLEIKKDGLIEIEEDEIPHVNKIIQDNFNHLISIQKDNNIQLKVDFNNAIESVKILQAVKDKLDKEGLDRAIVKYSENNDEIIIEVSSFIHSEKFIESGLKLIKTVTRFSPSSKIKLEKIQGLDLIDSTYQITNANKEKIEKCQLLLIKNLPNIKFRRLPTLYYFKITEKVNPQTLRNFKTKTDLVGKSIFNISTSQLTITAENEIDYNNQLKRIHENTSDVSIEDKPFNIAYKIQFINDNETIRQSYCNKIINEIRKEIKSIVEFDIIKKHTKILFSYKFDSEEQRELFKETLSSTCSKYSQLLTYSYENEFGRTLFELNKNETLELENEKEVTKNVRQATFIFLTPEQKDKLSEQLERYGEDAIFREGIQIGKLIKKDKDRLKFRISDEFDQIMTDKEELRIDLSEIKKGYIKPIFPGELTNISRMINAMKKVTEPGTRVGYPVNRNLSNFLFDPNEARQSDANIEDEKQRIIKNLNEPLLKNQQKQLEAVAKTLLTKDLALIQGPPGTGKTTVIAEIIWQILSNDAASKILITSQTNLAVDNALERVKGKKIIRPIRIGNIDKFEDEGKLYSIDRIKLWLQAKEGSKEEKLNSDNAICEWIENIKSSSSKDEKYKIAVAKWKLGLDKKDATIKNIFYNSYFQHINIFAATCSECGSPRFSNAFKEAFNKNAESKVETEFDIVIMDEASKATPPELVLPLTLGKKVVIIGDHKQLPPMIDEQEFSEALTAVGADKLVEDWTKDDYKISQFEKLFKNAPKNFVASLDTQFRMHEQIMNCISDFYSDQIELENGLICGIKGEMNDQDFNVKASRYHGFTSIPFIEPKNHAIWVNVETPEGKQGTSYENIGEINAIKTVLKALVNADGYEKYSNFFKKDEDKEIGIITYYMPQMNNIRNAMYPTFSKSEWKNFEQHKFENEYNIPLRINTVDRFQGMERNIVIISTVRSNKQLIEDKGKIITVDNNKYPFALGFARELQRINVGFSRAKRLLIVIGNEKHFSHKPEYEQAIQKMHRIDIAQIKNLIK